MRAPAVNAACDTSIGALAALLSKARRLVSNDTGVAHVAAGLGVPSVVVFFATDPQRWAPLDRRRHVTIYDPQGVAPEGVIGVARELLSSVPERPKFVGEAQHLFGLHRIDERIIVFATHAHIEHAA